jgi:hypothetical protein
VINLRNYVEAAPANVTLRNFVQAAPPQINVNTPTPQVKVNSKPRIIVPIKNRTYLASNYCQKANETTI